MISSCTSSSSEDETGVAKFTVGLPFDETDERWESFKENLEYLLKFIKVDTLIVYGNDDKITPPYFAKILNKKIKNSKVVFMDGGHFAYLENKQKFIKTIKNFIMNNRW